VKYLVFDPLVSIWGFHTSYGRDTMAKRGRSGATGEWVDDISCQFWNVSITLCWIRR
jgi:hypothetical protein